ncbi:hypothetical protein NHQ30_008423 [Ciborinia camelliae]|nr:hypothetical protein NHQ30_008423 [Ciborinia camelliae]
MHGPTPFPSSMPIHSAMEKHFSRSISGTMEGDASLSSKIDAFPIGASMRAEFEKVIYNHAEFETLETKIIIPTTEYIVGSMARPNIKKYLGNGVFRKKIYMITGLKIARKGKVSSGNNSGGGGGSQLGIQPTPMIPRLLGLDVKYKRGVDEESSSSATDFIWAFNLRRIYYRRGLLVKSDIFADGATFTMREGRPQDEYEQGPLANDTEITVQGMDENDFHGDSDKVNQVVNLGNGETLIILEKM